MRSTYILHPDYTKSFSPEINKFLKTNTSTYAEDYRLDEVPDLLEDLIESDFYDLISDKTPKEMRTIASQLYRQVKQDSELQKKGKLEPIQYNPLQLELFDNLPEGIFGRWIFNDAPQFMTTTDLLLYSGISARSALTDNTYSLDTFKKLNQKITFSQATILGAIHNKEKNYNRVATSWTVNKNNELLTRYIGGSSDGDLRLWSKTLTPHTCIDPLGNQVPFHPHSKNDDEYVSGYHSIEISLLATAIKYYVHLHDETQLQNNLPKFYVSAKNNGTYAGGAFTPFGNQGIQTAAFMKDSFPFPTVEDLQRKRPHVIDYIPREYGESYQVLLDADDLIIKTPQNNTPALRLYPEEAEQFIQGIMSQILSGAGRTVPSELDDAIKYRLSNKYIEDQKL